MTCRQSNAGPRGFCAPATLGGGQDDDFLVENLADVLQIKETSTRAFATLVAAIASVSLLVGGIGIMNIMLGHGDRADPRDRHPHGDRCPPSGHHGPIPDRGRHAVADGGSARIVIGVRRNRKCQMAGWPAVVSLHAIVAAIVTSLAVGLVFGVYPARRAAALDPTEALRRE